MTLYLIGIGLGDEFDITLKGLEVVKKCKAVYLEVYTSKLCCELEALEKFYNKKLILANRELIEQSPEQTILKNAKAGNTALLVIGDPLVATTHWDLVLRARKLKIPVEIIHNASVVSAIGVTGLQVYKFGKVASIPFPENTYIPETPYNVLKENQSIGAHTLFLLDIKPPKFMSIAEAINYLQMIELKRNEKVFTSKTFCVGVARLGTKSQLIRAGIASELKKVDFGPAPHSLIVPGKLHFMEEEVLKLWKV